MQVLVLHYGFIVCVTAHYPLLAIALLACHGAARYKGLYVARITGSSGLLLVVFPCFRSTVFRRDESVSPGRLFNRGVPLHRFTGILSLVLFKLADFDVVVLNHSYEDGVCLS